ncbi:MAG TPA: type 1 glutamine amidotransferase [Rhodobacterales bacterium]|nr:type 1 glutamine amidotransferase [Rhodobacterales bacterium]
MHLAVLMANTDESAFAQRHPKDGEKWRTLLAPVLPGLEISVFSVKDGVFPAGNVGDFGGYIVTGSPASVHDGLDWQARLSDLIREIEAARVKLFGACYGHQHIALALGGTVGPNPGGWTFGVVECDVYNPAPWMEAGPIWLNAAHEEQVSNPPENAQILARGPGCAVGGLAIGDHVFTTQYHPEIDPDFMAALIDELDGVKPPEVIKAARESLTIAPENARFARWIARFFAD